MRLLTFEDYEVRVAPEALLVKPIRMLWNQDRSKQKEKFFQQMSYLFFISSLLENRAEVPSAASML